MIMYINKKLLLIKTCDPRQSAPFRGAKWLTSSSKGMYFLFLEGLVVFLPPHKAYP